MASYHRSWVQADKTKQTSSQGPKTRPKDKSEEDVYQIWKWQPETVRLKVVGLKKTSKLLTPRGSSENQTCQAYVHPFSQALPPIDNSKY